MGVAPQKKGQWWHYYRAVPREFLDVERKPLISFSLKTGDFTEAKRQAALISARLEQDWRAAKERGVSLCAQDAADRCRAAALQNLHGFEPKAASKLSDEDLLDLLIVTEN